ncbi:PrsW family intramembrane metalloprotease [Rhodococcoides fascians]|uniref:PrsW family intramembrane metalloprotease n=1 Tax=Rhodococcoides fascians TaxID=1828 RepID=UPI0009B88FDC|nr:MULTISPECIES: PrsW family intramembrane metalloprotease [Rhodococcus]OZF03180.1 protease PrsW [Rhodococcus sp. 15-1189-1-1a]OZF16983.1 protease PrsW [Rhodococcus sp. 14-2686-1-2]
MSTTQGRHSTATDDSTDGAVDNGRTAEQVRAQLDAIEASGRAARFHFAQPRNLCWWVFVVFVGYGVLGAFTEFPTPLKVYGAAIGASITLLAIYGIVLWWFTRHIDRYSPVPGKLILTALVWGGFAATMGIAIWANTPLGSIYAKLFGQQFAADWSAALAAPFTEEISKGLGVVLLIYIAPKVIRTAFDGFVVGAFVGLGFQIVEDVLYALNVAASGFGVDPGQHAFLNAVMRMVTGLSGHIAYSAIFGAGVVYLLGRRPGEPRNLARGLGLIVLAMLMHGVWDSMSALFPSSSFPVSMAHIAIAVVVFLAIVIWVFHLVVSKERGYLRDILAPEAADGVLTEDELTAITGDRKQRRRFRTAQKGRAAKHREKWIIAAASDLADHIARDRGANTPAVQFARSEVLRLRNRNT